MSSKAGEPLRVGVLGCGVIAYWSHLRTLPKLPGARLVGAAEPDPTARARAEKLTGLKIEHGAEGLLAREDIDAIVVSAPTGLHAELAQAAIEAGKHIYLEKPVAANVEDAARLVAAAGESATRAVVGFNYRHHPLYAQAREIVQAGELGAVHTIQSSFCEPAAALPGWKRQRSTGGGALLDLGSHHIDLFRWFLGEEVKQVTAASLQSLESEHDSGRMDLAMTGGAAVQCNISLRSARCDWFQFVGEVGTLLLDRHGASLQMRVSRRRGYGVQTRPVVPTRASLVLMLTRLGRPSWDPSHRSAMAAFVALARGERAPAPERVASLEDGLRVQEIVDAVERAAASGALQPVIRTD